MTSPLFTINSEHFSMQRAGCFVSPDWSKRTGPRVRRSHSLHFRLLTNELPLTPTPLPAPPRHVWSAMSHSGTVQISPHHNAALAGEVTVQSQSGCSSSNCTDMVTRGTTTCPRRVPHPHSLTGGQASATSYCNPSARPAALHQQCAAGWQRARTAPAAHSPGARLINKLDRDGRRGRAGAGLRRVARSTPTPPHPPHSSTRSVILSCGKQIP